MREQFVTYDIALKLKKLGFDELCFGLYKNEIFYRDYDTFQWSEFSNCIKAPLWQQAISWLYEKYGIEIYYGTGDYSIVKHDYVCLYKTVHNTSLYEKWENAILETLKLLENK